MHYFVIVIIGVAFFSCEKIKGTDFRNLRGKVRTVTTVERNALETKEGWIVDPRDTTDCPVVDSFDIDGNLLKTMEYASWERMMMLSDTYEYDGKSLVRIKHFDAGKLRSTEYIVEGDPHWKIEKTISIQEPVLTGDQTIDTIKFGPDTTVYSWKSGKVASADYTSRNDVRYEYDDSGNVKFEYDLRDGMITDIDVY
ncbi:MAG TPA: hypothetical protein VEA58_03165, partial [Anaerovoracaceae bacterium]|nr:hypothetical protein [Anaerovoracaceae bacterium]